MSLTLTPLQSDNFHRANVSPLAAPWTIDEDNDDGFSIVSNVCECELANNICLQYFTYSGGLPANQYASVTLVAAPGASSWFFIKIRATDNGQPWFSQLGYRFYVTAAGAWDLYLDTASTHNALLSGSGLTISAGDTFTIAAVGTSLTVMQNSTALGTVVDATYTGGAAQLGGEAVSSASSLQFSNFVIGSAAVATPSLGGGYGFYLAEPASRRILVAGRTVRPDTRPDIMKRPLYRPGKK